MELMSHFLENSYPIVTCPPIVEEKALSVFAFIGYFESSATVSAYQKDQK